MSEQSGDRPEPDRYAVEYARIGAGTDESVETALQEKLNEGSRQSWKLVSVVHDPSEEGVILVWDLQGFISG